jgi:hypothetical protein
MGEKSVKILEKILSPPEIEGEETDAIRNLEISHC